MNVFVDIYKLFRIAQLLALREKTDLREKLKHKIRPLVTPIEQTYESFVLRVLSELLVEGPSAPFYQALIESGLGQAFSPVTGKLLSILRV